MERFKNDPAPTFRGILGRNITFPLALGTISAALFLLLVAYLLGALGTVEKTDRVITQAYHLQKMDLDMEASMRGFLISGDERALEPHERARGRMAAERAALRDLVQDHVVQRERIDRIAALQQQWDVFAQELIAMKRREPGGDFARRLEAGVRLKQQVREEFDQFVATARAERLARVQAADRNAQWSVSLFVLFVLAVGAFLAWRGRRDLTALSQVFGDALDEKSRQAQVLAAQAWLREAQAQLSDRLAREEALEPVAHAALEFLSNYAGSVCGVIYVPREDGRFERAGTWGWPQDAAGVQSLLEPGRTLVTECASARRVITLDPAPAGYLRVASGMGEGAAASVLLAPLEHERRLCGVVEIGFMRPLEPRDTELMQTVGNSLGASLSAARTRQRLQNMLEEMQQLNEELQVQQEELRTSNEELEEQSRALKESQAHLENQQAELEQTNLRLSEQARMLEDQRDALREAQDELQVRAAQLERASQYKSEFLANMSHELRTPLNSALILARLLAENAPGNLQPEQVEYAESIYASGNDLLNLINDILDIAKVEAGKLEMRPELTPLPSLAEAMRTLFEPLAVQKGLQLSVALAPGLPQHMWTDRQRVEQILKNLLSNAVKFTERGQVALDIRQADERLVFEVRDTGIGIEPAQQELIFEAFQQADGTVSRRYGGTGLGLSISRDLARLLGGFITLKSTPGEGSTFTLALPVEYSGPMAAPAVPLPVAEPVVPRIPAPAAPPAVPLTPSFEDDRTVPAETRRTVLVIEDDERFARILFDLSHELGYRCLIAMQAQEGRELAVLHQPHAILLDMRLPDGSGLALLQQLKEDARTRHIPVHVLSVEDRAETALQMGAIGYAFKPASREQLHEVFRRLEGKLSQKVRRVLLVEDDARQRESVCRLIGGEGVEITAVAQGQEALAALTESVFDCMIIDLKLPDMSGQQLLERMASGESRSFPPVIVYTGRNLSREEEAELMRYSRSIIIKGARSPERLLDEVTLFLHQVESDLSSERQSMLRTARSREKAFEDRRILVVDDDVRNIFALSSALEQKGASVEVARNGVEALQQLERSEPVDLVLMDIMMPEMDGYTAMQQIRRNPRWAKLPIIAITAKAMRDDQAKCLAAGASDYLAKPIELERLFSLIRVWLPKL